jgi:hypothetical protein
MSTKKFHPSKMRVARTDEECAVLVVSNVKVRMEAKLFYHVHMCFLPVHKEENRITKLKKLSKGKKIRFIRALLFHYKDKIVPKHARNV